MEGTEVTAPLPRTVSLEANEKSQCSKCRAKWEVSITFKNACLRKEEEELDSRERGTQTRFNFILFYK